MPPAPPPSQAEMLAMGASTDIKRMDAQAVQALIPAMAQAQKELHAQLQDWLTKLGPNAVDEKFTVAQLKQAQVLLGIASATAGTMQKYPHASLPFIAGKAVQDIMGQAQAPKLAMQTINTALTNIQAKFTGMPSIQIKHAGFFAKGDKLVLDHYAKSAARYAGQVHDDLKFQFAVGLSKGETVQQLVHRISNLSSFRQAVDASHPPAAGGAMAASLTQRYHNWGRRLVLTELNNAYNHSTRASIQEAHKIDPNVMMVWDAANDMRVCPICAALNGTKVSPKDGVFKGGYSQPPAHPYCRCTLVPWWNEMAEEEEVPMPPSAEEVEAQEAAKAHEHQQAEELATKEQAERKRVHEQREQGKQTSAEDLAAYEAHQQAMTELAAKKAAEAEAAKKAAEEAAKAAEEAAKKAAEEEALYQKMLAEQAAAAQAAAEKAAQEAIAAANKAALEKKLAEEKLEAEKKAAAKAKKAAKLEAAAPAFNPDTSPDVSMTFSQKKKKGSGGKYLTDKGLHKIDANTYVGHGYKFEWQSGKGWVTIKSPKLEGYSFNYGYGNTKVGYHKTGEAPQSLAPPAPPKPTAPITPAPAPIKGFEWKAVGPDWVLHKGDVPTSQLVPKGSPPSTLSQEYGLGQQLAQHGLVPTGNGVMEGYGYKFEKLADGNWHMTHSPSGPVTPAVSKPSSSYSSPHSYEPPTPVSKYVPAKIDLEPHREGVVDYEMEAHKSYNGFHGAAFNQDADAIEGGAVRVLKVQGKDGPYFETVFKVTHPYGDQARAYGTGSRQSWAFRKRTLAHGVMKDSGAEESVHGKTRIATHATGATVEVGEDGALHNTVRIRAKSLEDLNKVMDDFSRHMGVDMRKQSATADLELQAKAKLAAKYDPGTFGKRMKTAYTPEQQRQVIEDVFNAQAAKHPVLKKAMDDAELIEVYPGHETLYSKALGKELAGTYSAMYHDGGAPADVAASIIGDTGLMSSNKRYGSGVFTTGMSTSTDFKTGGADGVFMRLSNNDPGSGYSNFRLVIDTEKVMGRLDWWAFNEDNYGRSSYNNYHERWSVPTMKNGYAAGGNEVMAPHGVPPSAIKRMICSDSRYREQVLSALRAKGVTRINGKPIEEIVTLK